MLRKYPANSGQITACHSLPTIRVLDSMPSDACSAASYFLSPVCQSEWQCITVTLVASLGVIALSVSSFAAFLRDPPDKPTIKGIASTNSLTILEPYPVCTYDQAHEPYTSGNLSLEAELASIHWA